SRSVRRYPCTVKSGVFNSCETLPKNSRRYSSLIFSVSISTFLSCANFSTSLVRVAISVVIDLFLKLLDSGRETSSYIFLILRYIKHSTRYCSTKNENRKIEAVNIHIKL